MIILFLLILLPRLIPGEYVKIYEGALPFFLPTLAFVVGFIVLNAYIKKEMKVLFSLLTLAPLMWAIAEFMWWFINKEEDFIAYSLSFDLFYTIGFMFVLSALIYHYYKQPEKQLIKHTIITITLVGAFAGILAYYFFVFKSFSFNDSTMQITLAYLAIDIFILLFSLLNLELNIRKRTFSFWVWIVVFTLFTIAGDLIYGIGVLDLTYAPNGISDILFNFSYGCIIMAFLFSTGAKSAKIKDVEEQYLTIFNYSGAATVMADEHNTILLANNQFMALTNYPKEEIIGIMHWPDIVDAKERKSILLMLNRMKNVESTKPLTKDIKLYTKKGNVLYCNIIFSFIPHTDIKVITLVDITNRKKLEVELKKINEDLQNFTFTVSHDLKEPLRNISSLATYLKRDYEDKIDEMGVEFLNTLVYSVSTMSKLVEDLLTLSRIGRKNANFSFVELNELIEEILQDLNKTIEEKNVVINCGKLPKAMVQKTWMKQVFQNLITNAMKFNESKQPTIDIACKDFDFYYEFIVKDNGIGIQDNYKERIFKLFEQLHPRESYGGTGAGLAIVKKIIKEHKGDIWVEGKEGEGSTFHFTIEKFFIGEL